MLIFYKIFWLIRPTAQLLFLGHTQTAHFIVALHEMSFNVQEHTSLHFMRAPRTASLCVSPVPLQFPYFGSDFAKHSRQYAVICFECLASSRTFGLLASALLHFRSVAQTMEISRRK